MSVTQGQSETYPQLGKDTHNRLGVLGNRAMETLSREVTKPKRYLREDCKLWQETGM